MCIEEIEEIEVNYDPEEMSRITRERDQANRLAWKKYNWERTVSQYPFNHIKKITFNKSAQELWGGEFLPPYYLNAKTIKASDELVYNIYIGHAQKYNGDKYNDGLYYIVEKLTAHAGSSEWLPSTGTWMEISDPGWYSETIYCSPFKFWHERFWKRFRDAISLEICQKLEKKPIFKLFSSIPWTFSRDYENLDRIESTLEKRANNILNNLRPSGGSTSTAMAEAFRKAGIR